MYGHDVMFLFSLTIKLNLTCVLIGSLWTWLLNVNLNGFLYEFENNYLVELEVYSKLLKTKRKFK